MGGIEPLSSSSLSITQRPFRQEAAMQCLRRYHYATSPMNDDRPRTTDDRSPSFLSYTREAEYRQKCTRREPGIARSTSKWRTITWTRRPVFCPGIALAVHYRTCTRRHIMWPTDGIRTRVGPLCHGATAARVETGGLEPPTCPFRSVTINQRPGSGKGR